MTNRTLSEDNDVKIAEACTGSGKTSWPAGAPYVKNDISISPRDLNLPHDEWRKHQLETLLWLTNGEPHKVVSLVKTKSLQSSQYEQEYGFDAHYGRANYLCKHPGANPGTYCNECMFINNGGMHACPVSSSCGYLLSKDAAINSKKASLNYAYWMTATNWRINFPPEMLFCDEAHNLSEIVLNWVGVTIREITRKKWDLPEFPTLDSTRGGGILIKRESPIDTAMDWLEKSLSIMSAHCVRLEYSTDKKLIQEADKIKHKLSNVISSLSRCSKDWFIYSGSEAGWYKRAPAPAFICKPLTAKHSAPRYFTGKFKTVLMSATIGNPETYAQELGLEDYEFRAIPNQWPVESRRVHILDAPKLGYNSGRSVYNKQADEIAKAIGSVDSSWSGFIHVTRKAEAKLLAERLAKRGLRDRVWVPPGSETGNYVPTDKQIAAWHRRRKRIPNSLCITWSMWEGIDGRDERICGIAKIPFGALGSAYERARLRHSNSMYLQRAAWQGEQGLGRTRRGREQDYDIDGSINGLVFIADGNVSRVIDYLSANMRESLVEGV